MMCISHIAQANGSAVTNVTLTQQNTSASTTLIQFSITWNNSWYGSINKDAAWVFVKFKKASDGLWYHAKLKTAGTNPTGFSRGTGTTVDILVPTDKVGCFIQRSAAGFGTVTVSNIQLVWDWGAGGNNLSAADTIDEVRVFAIEMVYVPTAAFYAGDTSSQYTFKQGTADTDPWYIANESAITTQNAANNVFYYNGGGDAAGSVFTIPAIFPKGYSAFYCMKYEVSQGQYRDFLNTLATAQKAKRTSTMTATKYIMSNTDTVSNRNGLYTSDGTTIVCDFDDGGTGDEADDGEWIAMNYMSWPDLCAYADWAGLRPMTELEFEKACRGTLSAISGEYGWGTASITQAQGAVQNSGLLNEVANSTGNGLCNHNGAGTDISGPIRCGFAATGSTTRGTSGATYYGIMEMSGNCYERAVTVGNSTGRLFQGTHGDGTLTTTESNEGNATNTDWPGINVTPANGVDGATGSGCYGGDWVNSSVYVRVSNRFTAAYADSSRGNGYGGRAARTLN